MEIYSLTAAVHLVLYLDSQLGGAVCRKAVIQRCSVKNVFLNILQNSQENTCARVSFYWSCKLGGCNFIKKKSLAQVFSCEFCKISKNTFSYRTPLVAASNCHLYCNSKYYHSSSEAYLEPCQISMIELFWGNS